MVGGQAGDFSKGRSKGRSKNCYPTTEWSDAQAGQLTGGGVKGEINFRINFLVKRP